MYEYTDWFVHALPSNDSNGAKPELLWRGYDYNGNLCKEGTGSGSLTAWPALNHHEIKPSPINLMICVDSCAETTRSANNSLMAGGDYYGSQSFLSSYCIPKHPSNFSSYSSFTSNQEEFERAVADMDTAKWLMVVSSLSGIACSFLYLRLVACIGRMLMWLTMLVTVTGGMMLSALLIQRGGEDLNDPENEDLGTGEVALGVILLVLVLMILLSVWFIRFVSVHCIPWHTNGRCRMETANASGLPLTCWTRHRMPSAI